MNQNNIRRKHAFVLTVVIMSILVIFILVMGILSRTTSRALSSDSILKRITAEVIAKGAVWKAVEALHNGWALTNYTEYLNGNLYTVTYSSSGSGPGGTSPYTVLVTY